MDRNYIIPEAPRGASMLIEIPVPTAGVGSVALPVVQQLLNDATQKIVIKAMRVIPVTVLTNAVTNTGVNAPLTELKKLVLVLYSQGWEKGQYIPLLSLVDIDDQGTTPFRYHTTKFADWTNVDWQKSKLQWANGTVSAGTPYNVLLEVEYERFDNNNNPIDGVR